MDTMMSAPAPQMLVSNVVQLVNESDQPFNMEYGPGQRLVLAPNGTGGDRLFVNEEVAWYFLGRWWTDNSNPRNKARQDEYQRLRTLYGAYEDDRIWMASPAQTLAAYAPDGQRITTVVDDPDGVLGGTSTQLGKEMSLESQLKVMQDTVLQLQAQMAAQQQQNANQDQPAAPVDARPPSASAMLAVPGQQTAEIGGQQVPVAPPTFIAPEVDEPGAPARLPVVATVAHDPSEADAPEDAPASIPHGDGRMGGRVSAT